VRLSERAMIVNLSIGLWSPVREDEGKAREIAVKYGADSRMGKYRKYLVDPDALKPLQKLRGEIRNGHYERTLPWGQNGDQILAGSGFMAYRDWIAKLTEEFESMVAAWCESYPAEREKARSLLNGLFNDAEYPDPDEIRGKFYLKVRYKQLDDAGDFRCALSDADVKAIISQNEADRKQDVANALSETGNRIKEVVGRMAEALKAYGLGTITRKCRTCGGEGRIEAEPDAAGPEGKWELQVCAQCDGKGKVRWIEDDGSEHTGKCEACKGKGSHSIYRDDCLECEGTGEIKSEGIVNPFRDSLVGNVRDLVDMLPGLNITGDAGIEALMADMREYLTVHDANTLRTDETVRSEVAARADRIVANLADYGL